jgi:hypothetical protein
VFDFFFPLDHQLWRSPQVIVSPNWWKRYGYSTPNSFRVVQIYLYESEYLTFDIISVSKYLNRLFIMLTSNYILSDMVDTIHIWIRIWPEI